MDRDTGRSKGFGFVEMGSDQEAQAAIAALAGKEFQGRDLTVNEARPREDRGGGGGRGYGGGGGRGGYGAAVAAGTSGPARATDKVTWPRGPPGAARGAFVLAGPAWPSSGQSSRMPPSSICSIRYGPRP